jgi:flagellar biosynthesis/type III secretory pathway M-ring protein FliF/YscJ
MNAAALLARWNALNGPVRIGLIVAIVVVLAIVALASAAARPNRVALFATPLHNEQLAEVQERLASWNVPFTPTADNVVVDTKRRSELLLRLSLAGVPHAHIDSSQDLLGKLGALTPQAVVDAQTRDGLAGDIELALRGIAGIDDVRVIVAPAKPGYFADETSRDASASVRVRLRQGATLSHDAIAGIRSFVAASVPGLDQRRVTIVDDRGVALGEAPSTADGAQLQESLQTALDAAIGSGNSIVRVRVEYDSRRQTIRDVRHAPLGDVTVTNSGERYAGDGKRYEKTSQQYERGTDTREVTTENALGNVTRISAAVFVDNEHASDVPKVRSLAAATLGLIPSRGDSVSVQAIALHDTPVARKDAWWLAYGAVVPSLPTAIVVLGFILATRFAAKPLSSTVTAFIERSTITSAQRSAPRLGAAQVRETLRGEPVHAAAAIISALPASTAAAVLEMYPPHERDAIIRRMQRPSSPLIPDPETFIARA